jgi:nucleotide-binding universal stress UspA family protein
MPNKSGLDDGGVSRRRFLQLTAGAAAGVAGGADAAAARDGRATPRPSNPAPMRPDMRLGGHDLVVKPVLTYELPSRRESTSWRNWGELHTKEAVAQEMARIGADLAELARQADYPVRVLPPSAIAGPPEVDQIADLAQADVVLIYAAGGWVQTFDALLAKGKPAIFFIRHKSGPYYLWHEIVHPRYLRAHSDRLARTDVDYGDVVVDDYDELRWRLRALYGVRNTRGRRILAIGGPGGWATGNAPDLARQRWDLDIQTVDYGDLEVRLQQARADEACMAAAERDTVRLLGRRDVSLETKREFVVNSFVLTDVFLRLLAEADAHAITVNGCMGRIMPPAQTAPCLALNLLNDAGYMAYCESDFVVIPAGILLHFVSGKPTFLCNPTYPHHGTVTFAHCTAPRRMNGADMEPVRIVTHYESDYGAAPKVQFRKGQVITAAMPDFEAKEWVGYRCEILDHPFLPICRSQIEARIAGSHEAVADLMRGFHHMIVYGDYLRELGYALKKVGIGLANVSAM